MMNYEIFKEVVKEKFMDYMPEKFKGMELVVKSTPVASFIILCLIWIPSKNLSVFISFLMVLPVIYTNILEGIRQTDRKILEMAKVFRVNLRRQIRYIYVIL